MAGRIDGIESVMTYHTIIETCKNLGLNVRGYLTFAFRECMKVKPDFASINPGLLAASERAIGEFKC